jgi:hypothetical protein
MVLPDHFTPGFWTLTAAALLAAAVVSLGAWGFPRAIRALMRLNPPPANDNEAVFASPRSRIFEV